MSQLLLCFTTLRQSLTAYPSARCRPPPAGLQQVRVLCPVYWLDSSTVMN
nr:MAG TPA: hypothetical protein [Caudoviricetes sp.]